MDRVELESHQWGFIAGPKEFKEPFFSTVMYESEAYELTEIEKEFLSFDGIELIHDSDTSWWNWEAEYKRNEERINLQMAVAGDEDRLWGGTAISASCSSDLLLNLWSHLRRNGKAVWLHSPDCRIYSPESFKEEIAYQDGSGNPDKPDPRP